MKDYKGTIADYMTLIELSPRNKDYYMERATTYASMGLNDKSIADYEHSLGFFSGI